MMEGRACVPGLLVHYRACGYLARMGPLWSLIVLFALLAPASVCAQAGTFGIWKGEERVGSVFIQRMTVGGRTKYAMTSLSNVHVVWPQEIRTSVTADYENGELVTCRSSLHVNDALRDSSHMWTWEGMKKAYVHPGRSSVQDSVTTWTTSRMYYEEPLGQKHVYVESVLVHCPLERIGEGLYRLTLPNGHVNRYVYKQGVLHEVHVDRALFDLVFRRS